MATVLFISIIFALLLFPAQRIADKIGCSAPLPGPSFPWVRCAYSCEWCDNIAEFERQEPRASSPYR